MADSISISEEPLAKRLKSTRSSVKTIAPVHPTIYQPLDKSMSEGQGPATETISINGIKHPIRPNLAAGLRRFRARSWRYPGRKRRRSRPISIWADAICIDQNSIEERNHQVPLMRFIFSECDYAFSWLGESDETSDLAMDSISRLAAFERGGYIRFQAALTQQGSPFCEAGPWIAIRKLLEREFWYRVWIFQEIVLPEKLVLACGSKTLSWTTFKILNDMRVSQERWLDNYRLLRRELAHLDLKIQDEMIAVCSIAQNFFDIFYTRSDTLSHGIPTSYRVMETIHLRATDARDKIYGLLALEENPTLLPDYSKTATQFYTELAKSTLSDRMQLLQYSSIFASGNNTDLASWVPNWDLMTRFELTTAAKWRGWMDPEDMWFTCMMHLKHVGFHDLPHLTALHIRGQLRSRITDIKSQDEWLEVQNYKATINSMYGILYPRWSEGGHLQEPVQKLVALQRTFMQSTDRNRGSPSTREMELAAGFCYTTISSLNRASDTAYSAPELSLSMLLEMLATEFEYQPEAFSRPERYENDYMLSENESLHRRVFLETSTGRFGLGPPGVQEGDIICNIYGFRFPLLLRKVESHYVIVGTCWVLGCMEDQGLDGSKSEMLEIW